MHFYRSFNKIKAFTFDLDDTLYDNTPFMVQAEAALINSLRQNEQLTDEAINCFIIWRNKIVVPEQTVSTLAALSQKYLSIISGKRIA